ncbi:DUF4199 domain-containing protein [Niabella sp. W65]|nr:DUF4199 domain-containing protein [Niabella sp. W65]MCH7367003.1 DUF4199 domain-containing protein [Niabella sp. W65]ULT42688.1 DUF4199 domain-containing protein [Niabella sp. I65]
MKLNATIKGLVTGLLMVAVAVILYFNKLDERSPLNYLGYFIFGLGIVWSITSFAKHTRSTQFKDLFQQGFKCVLAATLVMALYTFIYFKLNEKEIDAVVQQAKLERIKTARDRTPAEIETEAQQTRKYYIPFQLSILVFSNLFTGVIVTMATAGSLYLRNKNS